MDLPVAEWAREEGIADEEMRARIARAAGEAYAAREKASPEVVRRVEKHVVMTVLDGLWREHLLTLDHLKQVVGWRAIAQRDPLGEYKHEAFDLLGAMIDQLRENVTVTLMRVEVARAARNRIRSPASTARTSTRRPGSTRWLASRRTRLPRAPSSPPDRRRNSRFNGPPVAAGRGRPPIPSRFAAAAGSAADTAISRSVRSTPSGLLERRRTSGIESQLRLEDVGAARAL
jgi:preprotein translocase subunit SecA